MEKAETRAYFKQGITRCCKNAILFAATLNKLKCGLICVAMSNLSTQKQLSLSGVLGKLARRDRALRRVLLFATKKTGSTLREEISRAHHKCGTGETIRVVHAQTMHVSRRGRRCHLISNSNSSLIIQMGTFNSIFGSIPGALSAFK